MMVQILVFFLVGAFPAATMALVGPSTTTERVPPLRASLDLSSAAIVGTSVEALASSAAVEATAAIAAAGAALASSSQDLGKLKETSQKQLATAYKELSTANEATRDQLRANLDEAQRQAATSTQFSQSQLAAAYKELATAKDLTRDQLRANLDVVQKQASETLESSGESQSRLAKAYEELATATRSQLRANFDDTLNGDTVTQAKAAFATFQDQALKYFESTSAANSELVERRYLANVASLKQASQDVVMACLDLLHDIEKGLSAESLKTASEDLLRAAARLSAEVSGSNVDFLSKVDPWATLAYAAAGLALVGIAQARGLATGGGLYESVAAGASNFLSTDSSAKKAFTLYCLQHNKVYKTEALYREHFQRWRKRAAVIDTYNKENPTKPNLALNQFADLPGDDDL
mmetsp:Transcript_943/g.3210  ORF Transcript_943/g.3210 Transcript_943/m.3210 type:complete len:408 (+) Transcript_943:3-1226(+)